jgi:hypothetical protein
MDGGARFAWRLAAGVIAVAPSLAACTFDWSRESPSVTPPPMDDAGDTDVQPSSDSGNGGDDGSSGRPNDAGSSDGPGTRPIVPAVTAWVTPGTSVNGQTFTATSEVPIGTGEPAAIETNVFGAPTVITIDTPDGAYDETACLRLIFPQPVSSVNASARRLDDSGMSACPTMTACHEVDVFAFTEGQPSANGGYQHLSRDDLWFHGSTYLSSALPDGTSMVLMCPWRPTQLASFQGVAR